jgi:threonine dehydrogenase-like Zn-dependent dehydrogenase
MSKTMRAARFYAAKDIRVEDVEMPKRTGDQVLVAIEWCGICGTDLSEYLYGIFLFSTAVHHDVVEHELINLGPLHTPKPKTKPHPLALLKETFPTTLGHEFCGRVLEAPSGSSWTKGQAVMVDPHLFCKNCTPCSARSDHLCDTLGFVGVNSGAGGLAEMIAVDPSMLHALPSSANLDQAALIEPLAVAWHAIKLTGMNDFRGIPILIVGGGPVGYAVASTLKVFQADQVFLSEPVAKRGEMFKGLVKSVINPVDTDVKEAIKQQTGGIAGVKIAIDCSGKIPGIRTAIQSLLQSGTCICVGVPSSEVNFQTLITLRYSHRLIMMQSSRFQTLNSSKTS